MRYVKSNFTKVSVRLNLNNPEHAKIVSILNDLNKNFHTTKSAFVIEALTYYIRNVSDSTLTNDGEERFLERQKEFATREYVDNGLRELDRSLRLFVYEKLEAIGKAGVTTVPNQNVTKNEDSSSEDDDLTRCDAIMRSIDQWAN